MLRVGDWSEHLSSSGKKYYYNCKTEVSQWEKPREWLEKEQQRSRSTNVHQQQLQQQQPQVQQVQIVQPVGGGIGNTGGHMVGHSVASTAAVNYNMTNSTAITSSSMTGPSPNPSPSRNSKLILI